MTQLTTLRAALAEARADLAGGAEIPTDKAELEDYIRETAAYLEILEANACNMVGHADRACEGFGRTPDLHLSLMRSGFGVSTVPGPSHGEIEREGRELRGMPAHREDDRR